MIPNGAVWFYIKVQKLIALSKKNNCKKLACFYLTLHLLYSFTTKNKQKFQIKIYKNKEFCNAYCSASFS